MDEQHLIDLVKQEVRKRLELRVKNEEQEKEIARLEKLIEDLDDLASVGWAGWKLGWVGKGTSVAAKIVEQEHQLCEQAGEIDHLREIIRDHNQEIYDYDERLTAVEMQLDQAVKANEKLSLECDRLEYENKALASRCKALEGRAYISPDAERMRKRINELETLIGKIRVAAILGNDTLMKMIEEAME